MAIHIDNPAGLDALAAALPASPERDELLHLARIGLAFRTQHKGRRPGFLRQYLAEIVASMPAPVTFDKLLEELELEAARRNLRGAAGSPIESVNRIWSVVTYHHPRDGRQQVTFKTLRNHLSPCKKK